MINFWKFRKIVIFSFLTIIFSLFLLFFQPNFSYEEKEKWEKNLNVRTVRRSKRSNVENKATAAWNKIKTDYLADLKALDIDEFTNGGEELEKTVQTAGTEDFADLPGPTQTELKKLIEDENWEKKTKDLIAKKKAAAAEAAWNKIKDNYLDDLKALGLEGTTDDGKELEKTVQKAKSDSFADLDGATQAELKKLVEDKDWEAKLQVFTAKKKAAAAEAAWNKIKDNYLDDLKALGLEGTTDDGKELEKTVQKAKSDSFADLDGPTQAELKKLVEDENWEEKTKALIAKKKAAAAWKTLKKDYWTSLKDLNLEGIVINGKKLEKTVKTVGTGNYTNLDDDVKTELKELIKDKQWEAKLKALIFKEKQKNEEEDSDSMQLIFILLISGLGLILIILLYFSWYYFVHKNNKKN